MAKRLVIDPITRIEGHLRIDVEVEHGSVQKAWASCTMWRGIENILLGRDPTEAWLFAQRFCGVCTTVHALASVRAVEDALEILIPPNAQFIRNMILGAHALHDHIVHFYHLSALDWIDVTDIPNADPKKASALGESLSDWPRNSTAEMAASKQKVVALLESGQLGIFAHGYWGHPAMQLPPEVSLLAFSHYLQALEYQRKANQVVGMLGGKTPHVQNMTVGGVSNAINPNAGGSLNLDRLYRMKSLIDEVSAFVHQVYLPDACAIAGLYSDWFEHGAGDRNFLAVPDLPTDARAQTFDLPGGVIMGGDLASVRPINTWQDQKLRSAVSEDITHAWYEGKVQAHPWEGETRDQYTDYQPFGKYSWVKAPRYDGKPMEVGPLAGVLIGYAQGHERTVRWADQALASINAVARREVTLSSFQSTMGRYAARAIRAAMLAELIQDHWLRLVDNVVGGDGRVHTVPRFPPGEVQGVGFHEAPRGTLSHWTVVNDGKLANYQAVVPTTWNASPRDAGGKPGPYEAALVGVPIADVNLPLEVLRTVHAFDPCMACACHVLSPDGQPVQTIKVL
ncbi:MAG: nickel-dependent hydrogenase large subunit [Myxococcota bacterium]